MDIFCFRAIDVKIFLFYIGNNIVAGGKYIFYTGNKIVYSRNYMFSFGKYFVSNRKHFKTIKNEHIKVISKWYHLPYGATALKCTNTINISTCSPCILSIMHINIGGIFTFLVHFANRKYPACVPLSHHLQFSIDPHNFLTKIPSQQLENDFDNFLIL